MNRSVVFILQKYVTWGVTANPSLRMISGGIEPLELGAQPGGHAFPSVVQFDECVGGDVFETGNPGGMATLERRPEIFFPLGVQLSRDVQNSGGNGGIPDDPGLLSPVDLGGVFCFDGVHELFDV